MARYGKRILDFDVVKNFELMDKLMKPVFSFDLYGNPKVLFDLQQFLAGFPYGYLIMTKKGSNLHALSPRGVYTADIFISRFPNLLKFIHDHWRKIPNDLWGMLYG
ncbi:MAG: hypothetical protein ACRENG_23760, partial [bacterium]